MKVMLSISLESYSTAVAAMEALADYVPTSADKLRPASAEFKKAFSTYLKFEAAMPALLRPQA